MSFFDKLRVYMSLHDVSKHDDQRLDPKANASDTRAQRDAHGTNSVNYVTDASDSSSVNAIRSGNLRLVKSGTTTLNGNATSGVPIIVTIPHGLSYIPIAIVYFNYATAYLPTPNGTGFSTSGGQVTFNNWSWSSTDGTNLYINFFSGATTDWGIIPYRYYLFHETAN